MANTLPHNAFTSTQAVDPSLRKVARFLPGDMACTAATGPSAPS